MTTHPDTGLFDDVFNASPIGIVVENLDGQPLFVNSAFCTFLGFSQEELRRKHCVDFSPAEDAEKDWTLFQQLRDGLIDHYQLEKRYFRRDGSLVWGLLTISLLSSRSSPLILAMVEDITDKKKTEEAQVRHAAVIESSDDAIASGTLDGIIVSWNAGAQKMYGYTEAEAVGKPISMLLPPELPNEENRIIETLRAGGRIEHFETVRVAKTGKRINVSLTISPIRDSSGKTVGCSGIARDITERKRAEEELRASEERSRLAQEAARIGSFEWNIQTGINTWTPELEAMHGLPPGSFGGTQTDWVNRLHPEDRAEVLRLTDTSLKTGRPTTGEWRVLWPDGSVHWIAAHWQTFMNASGEPSRIIGVNIDITERKRTEEALRISEERLRLAQWAAHIGTFDVNIKTGVDIWQPELEALYGLPPGGFRGTLAAFEDLIHPHDRERVIGLTQEMMRTGEPTAGEWRVVWPDGSVHWIAGRGQVLMDDSGKPSRMLGVNMDVTERKLAENRLREYERAVQGVEEVIVVVDREYRVLMANREFLKRRNLTSEQVVGHFVHELVVPEVYEAIVKPRLDECFQGKAVSYELKYTYPHLGERDLLASYYPVEGKDGVDRAACILHDITDRKRAEAAVAGMSRKLLAAQEQERMRIARELHDDICQRLALLVAEVEASKQNQLSSVEDMSQILSRFRDQIAEVASDVQSISHQLHSSKLEYLGFVVAMRSLCRELAARHNVAVDFTSDAMPRDLPHDISLCLFRVLQEALHNAVKHSRVRHFEVTLGRLENELQLTLSDRGVGFDKETIAKGTGLGLVSMRERVRLVNGTIEIDSKPMRGTTIHVRVPLRSEHPAKGVA